MEWLSIDKQMPETNVLVLLWQSETPNPVLHLGCWCEDDFWWSEIARSDIENVTHWLSFPAPPGME